VIVIGGEALVDLVPDSSTPDGELGPLYPMLGGGPYNVAIALGRLGVPTAFLARVSTDLFGAKILDRLRESTVDTGLVRRTSDPTTLAVVALGEDGSAHYTFHTAETASSSLVDPGPLPDHTEAVSFGTLSLVLEPSATAYETVLHREAGRGRFIVLDPNIRADLIDSAEAYRKRFVSWLPSVSLLKLSVEDARWLAGEEDPLAAARRWRARGPAAVVLTRGDNGLVAFTDAGEVEVSAPRVEVVDTIGAGDTVQAALLAWLYRANALSAAALRAMDRARWERALRFAASAAAVTVSRAGAQPPSLSELETRDQE
jgi:fructokinase